MANPVSTTVSFPFSDSANGGTLDIQNGGGYVGLQSVAVMLRDTLKSGILTLYCSVGSLSPAGFKFNKGVSASFSQVSGVSVLDVPDGVPYRITLAFRENGTAFTPTEISRIGGRVIMSEKFWGLLSIDAYTEEYEVYAYTPQITRVGQARQVTYGTIAAFRAGVLAVVDVFPPIIANGQDELEVYRVESQVLLNGDGEWEMPNGWPNAPTYPNGATPPKPRIGVVSTRVHEIGMVTKTGYFYTRTFSITNQKPYFGNAAYKPATSVVQGSGFSKLSPDMQVKALEAMNARGKGAYA